MVCEGHSHVVSIVKVNAKLFTEIDPEDSSYVSSLSDDDDYNTTDTTLTESSSYHTSIDEQRKHIVYQGQLDSLFKLVRFIMNIPTINMGYERHIGICRYMANI